MITIRINLFYSNYCICEGPSKQSQDPENSTASGPRGFEIPGNATDNNKYNYLIAVINHKYDTNFELLTICYDFIWRMPVERIYNHEFYLLQQSKRRKYIDKNFRNKS